MRRCGRLAATSNTTPLTGHCVSLPTVAPGCAITSLLLYSSLVAQANRHTPDIKGSKLPAILPCGFSHATAAAPFMGLQELAALAFSDGPQALLHCPPPARTVCAPATTSTRAARPITD